MERFRKYSLIIAILTITGVMGGSLVTVVAKGAVALERIDNNETGIADIKEECDKYHSGQLARDEKIEAIQRMLEDFVETYMNKNHTFKSTGAE